VSLGGEALLRRSSWSAGYVFGDRVKRLGYKVVIAFVFSIDGGRCLSTYTNSKAAETEVRVPDPSV